MKFSLLLIVILLTATVVFAQEEPATEPVVVDLRDNTIRIPPELKGFKIVKKPVEGDLLPVSDEATPVLLIEQKGNNTKENNTDVPEDMKDLFTAPSTPASTPANTGVSVNTVNNNKEPDNGGGFTLIIYIFLVIIMLAVIIVFSRKTFLARGNE